MRLAAGQDLAALVKAHLQTLDILVIDHLIVREDRLLPAATTTASAGSAITVSSISRRTRRTVTSGASTEARSLSRSALGRLVGRLLSIHSCLPFLLDRVHCNQRIVARQSPFVTQNRLIPPGNQASRTFVLSGASDAAL
jgi:hypothetical protein